MCEGMWFQYFESPCIPHVKQHSILTVFALTIQLTDSVFTLRGVILMSVPTTTCCSHDTPLFRMSTLEICTGRHLVADCLNCHATIGWWSTSSSGGDVSTRTTLPVSVTCFSKKLTGSSCGDVNFLNWNTNNLLFRLVFYSNLLYGSFRVPHACHPDWLTKFMGQSLSWEANSHSASQEIPHHLWNPKVHIMFARAHQFQGTV